MPRVSLTCPGPWVTMARQCPFIDCTKRTVWWELDKGEPARVEEGL